MGQLVKVLDTKGTHMVNISREGPLVSQGERILVYHPHLQINKKNSKVEADHTFQKMNSWN